MTIFDVLTMLGGLALFLYGMNTMGEGLTKIAGGRLERILAKLTSNPVKAVFLGIFVTAVIQSSSATTVMVVGFVNSGIMKLSQAIGIIMGANVGTTVTAWILSLSGIESDSLFMQFLKPSNFAPVLAVPEKERHRYDPARVCHIDVWNGYDERGGETAGGCAGIYEYPDDVFQSDPWHAGWSCPHGGHPEFFRIGWYFAGALRYGINHVRNGISDHHGTKYRYVLYGAAFCDRRE